ncbi:MAG TPA: HepT-like ribonuclease domain-containing protein, partial [Bacteroidia bacterium]|nr:HepT-like ribonuclease domain-containing protein [Bacteroidia bacterium]
FLADSKTREAVYRNIEVMGEAANRMPEEYMIEHSEIEWHKIISTRNIIIHSYDEIDDRIIWNIIQNSLPGLKAKLELLLKIR